MKKLFAAIDNNKLKYIENLRKAVAIKSVSAAPENRPDIVTMMKWMGDELKALGAAIEFVDLGTQTLPDGTTLPLPPVLMGELTVDPAKKTLLVYGHLDVQPAAKEDGWDTDPWVLTEKDGKLYGRGSTDDKVKRISKMFCVLFQHSRDQFWAGSTPCSATRSAVTDQSETSISLTDQSQASRCRSTSSSASRGWRRAGARGWTRC